MKQSKYTSVAIAALLAFLLCSIAVVNSCKKISNGLCGGIVCQNNGTCNSGVCKCPTGFTGTLCEKQAVATMQYNNQTYTDMVLTVNDGTTTHTDTVSSGNAISFTASAGAVFTCSAFTNGTGPGGKQIGERLTWNFSNSFPNGGMQLQQIFTDSNFFFLQVQNHSANAATGVYVNYGLAMQSYDTVAIPIGSGVMSLGYYSLSTSTDILFTSGTPSVTWSFLPTFSTPVNRREVMTLN